MDKHFFNEIKQIIESFNQSLTLHLPALENEVNGIIEHNSKDSNEIEHCLDTLLSLTIHGVADDLFIQLLEYYKTVDEEGALFYWNEYDDKEA
jgi:hypothetical protein